jgi:hypothetical protein
VNEKSFSVFFGVDQTGATLQGGKKARPLPCAILIEESPRAWTSTWRVELLELESASLGCFQDALSRAGVPAVEWGSCALLLDCVLGLPHEVCAGSEEGASFLWKLFKKAAAYSYQGKSYGREAAEVFFAEILEQSGQKGIPTRQCEELAAANSVFRSRPFQKNIQTGTYRLWKDLGKELGREASGWGNFWPANLWSSPDLARPWIFEGYPSWIWKRVLGLPHRDSKLLKQLFDSGRMEFADRVRVKASDWNLLLEDADLTDAFVLAIGGLALQDRKELWSPPLFQGLTPEQKKRIQREGWILGL